MKGAAMSNARKGAWVATAVRYLVENGKRGGQRQKEKAST